MSHARQKNIWGGKIYFSIGGVYTKTKVEPEPPYLTFQPTTTSLTYRGLTTAGSTLKCPKTKVEPVLSFAKRTLGRPA